jgi:hypothetical protein
MATRSLTIGEASNVQSLLQMGEPMMAASLVSRTLGVPQDEAIAICDEVGEGCLVREPIIRPLVAAEVE